MPFCTKCENEVTLEAAFCTRCGTPLRMSHSQLPLARPRFPSSSSSSHRTRNILIIILVLVVLLLVVSSLASFLLPGPSTSSSNSGVAIVTGYQFFAQSAGPQTFSVPSCTINQPSSGNYVAVKFMGSSIDTLTEASFTYGGKTVTRDFVSFGLAMTCPLQPNTTTYMVFQNAGTGPYATVGESYTGSLAWADGTVLRFSGTFQ